MIGNPGVFNRIIVRTAMMVVLVRGGLLRSDEAAQLLVPEEVSIRLLENQPPISSDIRLQRAEAVAHAAVLRQYAAETALAQVCWQLGRLDRAVALLERHQPSERAEDHRGIEWHLLSRTMHAEKKYFRDTPIR